MFQHIEVRREEPVTGQYPDRVLLSQSHGRGGGHDGPVIPGFQKSFKNGNTGGCHQGREPDLIYRSYHSLNWDPIRCCCWRRSR